MNLNLSCTFSRPYCATISNIIIIDQYTHILEIQVVIIDKHNAETFLEGAKHLEVKLVCGHTDPANNLLDMMSLFSALFLVTIGLQGSPKTAASCKVFDLCRQILFGFIN